MIHDPSESVFTHTWKASIRSPQFCFPFSLMLQNKEILAFRELAFRELAFRELALWKLAFRALAVRAHLTLM